MSSCALWLLPMLLPHLSLLSILALDAPPLSDGDKTKVILEGPPPTLPPPRPNFTLRAFSNDNPVFEETENDNSTHDNMLGAIKFMRKFGYVPSGDDTADYIFSAESLSEKIKLVQKFGALPQTGELDEATLDLMQTPRCGVHDIESEEGKHRRKRFIVASSGWNKRALTYTVANWSPKLISKANVQMELKRAFAHWAKYSNLKFTEIDSSDADIIIFFAEYSHNDYYPFDGQGGTLAHAYYPMESDSYGGDIHFDESEDWKIKPTDPNSGLDFFTVAVHEIGHSLGLAHSTVPTSIMFPYYKGIETNFELDYDDIMGMWNLYINRKMEGDDEYFRNLATETTTATTTTTTTTTTPSYDVTQNDEHVRYHGDSETVDEHEDRQKEKNGDGNLPSLPPLYPNNDDDDYYERERKRIEEEDRRRREEEDEQRRKWEERVRREEEEDRKREEEEFRRREEERRRWEEEEARIKTDWENKRTQSLSTSGDVIPDICNGNFDSLATIRNEIFIFKGQYMWRYQSRGYLLENYPSRIQNIFVGLPNFVQKIDAVYERRNDSRIVFFIGKYFYVHDGNMLVEGSPRPITDYGIPESITEIGAVFYWPKNHKTYLFVRNLYWRRDDFADEMEENYPRGIGRWNGIPHGLDAVYTDRNGVSYFFRGKQVWEYDNINIKPTRNSPVNTLGRWTGC